MKKWINQSFKWYYKHRFKRLCFVAENPKSFQEQWLQSLIVDGKNTEWGVLYQLDEKMPYCAFSNSLPISTYDDLKPYIQRMMMGEHDILWKDKVEWFSKSSGTTNDKSKFIPISPDNLKHCQIKGTWDTMTYLYHNRPDARQFEYKSMLMGGSLQRYELHPQTTIGDVSAIMIHFMPSVAKPFFTPDFETALIDDWEEKLEKLAIAGSNEKDIVMIGGVPTWTIVLFKRILEITGKSNMLEVWPNFQVYIHGGVSFYPYQAQFEQFFPSPNVSYQEIYNASEGYFAVQDDFEKDDMVLLLDNGVFYEFLPLDQWDADVPKAIPLWEVEVNKHYAIVISTNAGLWRYLPGDTVKFTSTQPYKIKVTGRTKQFVNAFGEEVIVENTDRAIALTCQQTNSAVTEYTVAPIYMDGLQKGGHQWLIEFEVSPKEIQQFEILLDQNLQSINSDYEAKRHKDIALDRLKIIVLPNGTFHDWLRKRGKFGGQHKVPRLSNNRDYIDDILDFLEKNQ